MLGRKCRKKVSGTSMDERRKKLADLSPTEKIKILEKLRDRSLILAEARKKLAEKLEREKIS